VSTPGQFGAFGAVMGLGTVLALTVGAGLWGCPTYNVYSQRLAGEAELAKAEYTRRTTVLEAQAKLDSAAKLAEAEVARARGVAQANQIIGESLKGNEAYLRYLWIDKLDASKGQVVYVPTEGGLPILEAGKRRDLP
jgi:regulator of protease activity HflC (stomatin/prohibitin superfamily)